MYLPNENVYVATMTTSTFEGTHRSSRSTKKLNNHFIRYERHERQCDQHTVNVHGTEMMEYSLHERERGAETKRQLKRTIKDVPKQNIIRRNVLQEPPYNKLSKIHKALAKTSTSTHQRTLHLVTG